MREPTFVEAFVGEDSEKQANVSVEQQDPLEGQGVPHWAERLKHLGGSLGAVGGGLAGAALPIAAGLGLGHAAGDLLPGDGALHHLGADAAGLGGAALGVPLAGPNAAIGAGIGAQSGERLGRMVGQGVEALYPSSRHAVQSIKDLDPAEGLARIRALEQTGGDPATISAMRDAYNRRRSSFRDQLIAGP